MAYELLLSTTGTQDPVVIEDLGGRSFSHPTTDFDLLAEFLPNEVMNSDDLQSALDSGYVTLKCNNVSIDSLMEEVVPYFAVLADDVFAAAHERTGFPNRDETTVAFSDSSPDRTYTISPVSSEFRFYINGRKHVKTSAQSIQMADTEGVHYIYFDKDTQVLTETTTFVLAIITEHVLCAIVYWDASNSQHVIFGDERHGMTMDGQTHAHLHTSWGTRYISGLALEDITPDEDGSTDSHAQFGVESGVIRDEDLVHSLPAEAKPAQLPVLYKDGASGYWRFDAADNFPVKNYSGGSGFLAYNEYTGSTWQQAEVPEGSYVLAHIVATNDPNNPFVAIQGTFSIPISRSLEGRL